MGPIFINDDDEFITASVKRLGRIKIFIHTVAVGARRQHCPCVQLIKSTRSKSSAFRPTPAFASASKFRLVQAAVCTCKLQRRAVRSWARDSFRIERGDNSTQIPIRLTHGVLPRYVHFMLIKESHVEAERIQVGSEEEKKKERSKLLATCMKLTFCM